ncbi:MAG: SMP-30/gluconolactonase/LRE family protein [Pirellulaceae bacterium]|nr:SMP-30/gluconolactonase/LRE family protein [Pirellulaceae bacterium]
MKRTVRRIAYGLIGLVALLTAWIVKTAYDAGEFKSLQPHFAGQKRTITDVVGGEDITIDHARQIAYISADDRQTRARQPDQAVGGIYRLDISDVHAQPVLLKRQPNEPIAPHGISLYQSPSGDSHLFVVDHQLPEHRILHYVVEPNAGLRLVNTFQDATWMISPNDVVAIDEQRFYFTNDHGSATGWGKFFEEYLQLSRGSVVYYDGKGYSKVATQIAYANGINTSADASYVYVASPIGKQLIVYRRDQASGKLEKLRTVLLGTGVDNIERDTDGNLWVGCHPKLLSFVRHARDTRRLAPSQVLKLTRKGEHDFSVAEVFLDDGSQLSASSVAAVSGSVMLIGPVLDKKLLRCSLPAEFADGARAQQASDP